MIHVYEIPHNRSNGYCFDGGRPVAFTNVDWFQDPRDLPTGFSYDPTDEQLIEAVKARRYYEPARSYLILWSDSAIVIPRAIP